MLDKAELDFGIYRIMNQKRKEIEDFLEKDLLPQVKSILEENQSNERKGLETELAEKISQIKYLGYNPDENPAVLQLKENLAKYGNMDALEDSVFSHLATFFKRYYDNGDFISMRRYKKDVYAIPYEGEEVKLHWANADQYYIKTSEYLKNYSFTLADGRKVLFELVEASTEQNNNKAQSDKERRFKLADEAYRVQDEKTLSILFTYELFDKKTKQKDLNDEALNKLLQQEELLATLKEIGTGLPIDWLTSLAEPYKGKTKKAGSKEVPVSWIEYHITQYTARNTFDYFIHKDLGGFLRRELDFYIKNEVLFIDDINTRSEKEFVSQLSRLKAIKRIGEKIIAFLAQLEDFQKKLWLKKKMVVDAQYCITLDRVPEEFYPEIAANEAQREEWVKLFAINEITQDMTREGYTQSLSIRFLKENPFLVLDTVFFSEEFTEKLLARLDNLDEQTDGLLVNSENFQALNTLRNKHLNQIDCIYIDPPYNTELDKQKGKFIYKDDFDNSTWLSMMSDRLTQLKSYLTIEGNIQISIDDVELFNLKILMDEIFGCKNYIETFSWTRTLSPSNLSNKTKKILEYLLCYEFEKNSKRYTGIDNEEANDNPLIKKENTVKELIFPRDSVECRIKKDGVYKSGIYGTSTNEVELLEDVVVQNGKFLNDLKLKSNFIWEQDYLEEELKAKTRIIFKSDSFAPRYDKSEYATPVPANLIDETCSVKTNDFEKNRLGDLGFAGMFDYPKPISLIQYLVQFSTEKTSKILDCFAGSGSTGHAVINLNRDDNGKRKYYLVEMGYYFESVTKPRIQKVVYSGPQGKDILGWKDGKPTTRKGISHLFKYLRLESYEDTLNNLVLQRSQSQQLTLESNAQFKEGYMLGYMLDVESRGSLLNLEWFKDPFNVHLLITQNNETRPTKINLVETFNYLIGLVVNSVYTATVKGCKYKIVNGTTRAGDKTLVIWRQVSAFASQEEANPALNDFMKKSDYRPLDREFDRIWVNGDNNVENLKIGEERWKVGLIEEEFGKRMFEEK